MQTLSKTLHLPEGDFTANVDVYEPKDREALKQIYSSWRILCNQLTALKARKVNLPDGLSECGFCYFFNFGQCRWNFHMLTSKFCVCVNKTSNIQLWFSAVNKRPTYSSNSPLRGFCAACTATILALCCAVQCSFTSLHASMQTCKLHCTSLFTKKRPWQNFSSVKDE